MVNRFQQQASNTGNVPFIAISLVFRSVFARGDATVLLNGEGSVLQLVGVVIEEDVGVVATTTEEDFEVHMLGGGAARAASEADDLSGLHLLSHLHEILRLVTIEGDESVAVLNLDAVAVATVVARLNDLAVESRKDVVVGLRLDVNARVYVATAAVAIGADDVSAG